VVHVEAGLRSFDRSMPEEINRLVTDALSDLLLVSEPSGMENLRRENIPDSKLHLVGNIMIDTLEWMLPAAMERNSYARLGLEAAGYALLTLHRPSNVDHPESFQRLVALFVELAQQLPVVFPVHPRTRKLLEAAGYEAQKHPGLRLIEPVDYLDSLNLQKHARVVLTDSGGMQEETSHLQVPCITLRANTERPVTVELGTSTLAGNDPQRIREILQQVLSGAYKRGQPIPLWDGSTAKRIAPILAAALSSR
jgi:UDP-N-acetylglucosamine 2-epimerase (non-hydrolysing)